MVIDSPVEIRRVSVADFEVVEAVAVSPKELLVNAKNAGDTSLILWEQTGRRVATKYRCGRMPGGWIPCATSSSAKWTDSKSPWRCRAQTVFLRGTAKDLVSAERAAAIAGTLGKVVNLLRVNVPPVEAQVLLKVRFANIDRAAARDLGLNIISTGALNTVGALNTGQFSPPKVDSGQGELELQHIRRFERFSVPARSEPGRHHPGAADAALTGDPGRAERAGDNGKPASFVSGGEFPFPDPTRGRGGAGSGDDSVPRVWCAHQLSSDCDTARHHPAAGRPGGQLARFRQRPGLPGLQHPGAGHAARADRSRTGERAELRDRWSAGQPHHRDSEQGAGSGQHSAIGQAVPEPGNEQEQFGTARADYAGAGAAHPGRPAACRTWSGPSRS